MACIGIDIGTTHACVGVFHNGKVHIIANNQGFRSTPCYVSFTEHEEFVGDSAVNKAHANVDNTVYHLRRALGKSFTEIKDAAYVQNWSFNLNGDAEDVPVVMLDHKQDKQSLSADQFCTILIKTLKQLAEDFTGELVQHAVLTVPSHFNAVQRDCMSRAAEACGLNVLRVLNESTAAAIAYDLDLAASTKDGAQSVLVFDMGGATHDITLLNVDQGMLTVLATKGGDTIGGEDFTNMLVEHCMKSFLKSSKIDVKDNAKAIARLKVACEAAKRSLSQQSRVSVEVDSLAEGQDFQLKVSRSRFEDMIYELVKSCVNEIDEVLESAGYNADDVDRILLVGGSAHIPVVKNSIEKFFNKSVEMSVSPEEVVARGATTEANTLAATHDWGIDHEIQLNAVPLSLGIKASNGQMEHLINRDSILPASATTTVSTAQNDQQAVLIQVYEGERVMAQHNTLLAEVELAGLTAAPKGTLEIQVQFQLNKMGDLTVTLSERTSGSFAEHVVKQDGSRLTPADVKRIIQDAEDAAEEDDDLLEQLETEESPVVVNAAAVPMDMDTQELD